ncbi:MAG: AMP-binding protein [Campylobacterales bacterium]|nr:AMP-binding protein [Campylobacterales bacterium]
MQINIIQDDKSIKTYNLQECCGNYHKNKLSAIVSPKTKLDTYKEIFFCEQHDITAVCFDSSVKSIADRCRALNITELTDDACGMKFEDAKLLFFTSGTTSQPRGAIKSKKMIDPEVLAESKYLSKYDFDSFLVTVPLYHIYGYLFGYGAPKVMGKPIYTKELFMPQNIIDFAAQHKCVCITTPVFIKAMLKMDEKRDLSKSIFISSTGPLLPDEADAFFDKFGAEIVQIYGSTETGGAAYLERGAKLWQPIEQVSVSIDDESRLQIASPYVSTEMFEDGIIKLSSPFTTSDIARVENGCFEILGRSFELLKIGGKRVSVLEIEAAIEAHPSITEAQVIPIRTDGLKDEKIEILVVCEMDEKELSKLVSKILKELYSEIKINAKCRKAKALEKTFNGKKKRS